MKKKLLKQWIRELRLKSRKQTQRALHRHDGSMCCLGVLCDIAVDDYWVWDDFTDSWRIAEGHSGFPAKAQLKQFGLDEETATHLVAMNDGHGKSFKEIADWLESELLPTAT